MKKLVEIYLEELESSPKYEQEYEHDSFEKYLQSGRDWRKKVKYGLSTGEISPEYLKQNEPREAHWFDLDKWEPLPQKLYHVTINKSKVISMGLKTRDELNAGEGGGLGGGESDAISFTDSLDIAKEIYQSMVEYKMVADGKITIGDILDMAKQGKGSRGNKFANEIFKQYGGAMGEDGIPTELKYAMIGRKIQLSSLGKPPDNKHEWKPEKEFGGWAGKEKFFFHFYSRPMTEAEKLEDAVRMYKNFSFFRESMGGKLDPLFFGSDPNKIKSVPESEIALLEFKPKPNAMGYRVSSLNEWRTGTGDAVEFVKEIHINPEPFKENKLKLSNLLW